MPEYDEGLLRQLMHESLQQGEIEQGIAYLDELLKRYTVDQRIEQIKDMLATLVGQYPNIVAIRKRHKSVQVRLGNKVRLVDELTILAQQMGKYDD